MASVRNQSVKLVIAIGKRIFLQNDAEERVTLPRGTLVAGFFKGKWWQNKNKTKGQDQGDSQEPATNDIPFELKDASTMVQHGGKYVTLGSVILAKREVAPDEAKVCYHNLTDAPRSDSPGFFTLEVKHHCMFQVVDITSVKREPEAAAGGPSLSVQQGHIASALPWQAWETSWTNVCWITRWSTKGLMPVRPIVVTRHQLQLPGKRALECC